MPKSVWQWARNLLSVVGVVMTGKACMGKAVGSGLAGRDEPVLWLRVLKMAMVATAARSELPDEEVDTPRPPGSSDGALFVRLNVGEWGGCFIVVSPSYCSVMLA